MNKVTISQAAAADLIRLYFEDLGALALGFGFWPYEITVKTTRHGVETITRLRPAMLNQETPRRAKEYLLNTRNVLLRTLKGTSQVSDAEFLELKNKNYD